MCTIIFERRKLYGCHDQDATFELGYIICCYKDTIWARNSCLIVQCSQII
jgi:hypothetical protein